MPALSNPVIASYNDRPRKGIKVAEGDNRKHKRVSPGGKALIDCKVARTDTDNDLYVFVSSNYVKNDGPALHFHPDLDETFYILEGVFK